jgi:hypothetical protein
VKEGVFLCADRERPDRQMNKVNKAGHTFFCIITVRQMKQSYGSASFFINLLIKQKNACYLGHY